MNLLTLLPDLLTGGMDWVRAKQARKLLKVEAEIAIAKATTESKLELLRAGQLQEAAWENTALNNSGIKDEVMMFVILTPMVMCFFPGGAEIVREGFTAMEESLPSYWEYAFYATIAVSYGLKKFNDFKSFSKAG